MVIQAGMVMDSLAEILGALDMDEKNNLTIIGKYTIFFICFWIIYSYLHFKLLDASLIY